MPKPPLLTLAEVASRLGTTRNRALALIQHGFLPGVRKPEAPDQWQVHPDDLAGFLANLRQE